MLSNSKDSENIKLVHFTLGNSGKRILVVGDAVASTGFARVLHAILDRIKDKYDIHHLGINFLGDPHESSWRIYVAGLGGDPYGVNRLQTLIEKIEPALVFLVQDIWILVRYVSILKRTSVKCVMYLPVDGAPLDPQLMKELACADYWVVYTQFGEKTVQNAIAAIQQEDPSFHPPSMTVIPHGLDQRQFFPLHGTSRSQMNLGRLEAKKALLPHTHDFLESFIVLNANRNQPRKRIDITMLGFALFAQDKPRCVKLYLHMGIEDLGWNVVALAKRHGIDDRLIVSGMDPGMPSVPVEKLNLIYNCCEVGINTSIGEGWGLVSFEHAATGAAQIVPKHSACAELWQGAAEFLEPVYRATTERVLTEGEFVSAEDVASALQKLYDDRDHLERTSALSYATATREQYDWDRIANQWHTLFQQVLSASPGDLKSSPQG